MLAQFHSGVTESGRKICDAFGGIAPDCSPEPAGALLFAIACVGLAICVSILSRRYPSLRRAIDGLYQAAGYVAALFLIAILLLIVVQMAARWTGFPAPGVSNYAGYCMAASSFFALAITLRRGGHIRVNLLLHAMGRSRWLGELWCYGIAAGLATYLSRYAIKTAVLSEKIHDISQGQDATPLWIPQLAMCVGSVLVAFALWEGLVFTMLDRHKTSSKSTDTL